jgi:hypothetical protein
MRRAGSDPSGPGNGTAVPGAWRVLQDEHSVTECLAGGPTTPLLPTSSGSSVGEPGTWTARVCRARASARGVGRQSRPRRAWLSASPKHLRCAEPRQSAAIAFLESDRPDDPGARERYGDDAAVRCGQSGESRHELRAGRVRRESAAAIWIPRRAQAQHAASTNLQNARCPDPQPCSRLPKTVVFGPSLVPTGGTHVNNFCANLRTGK